MGFTTHKSWHFREKKKILQLFNIFLNLYKEFFLEVAMTF